MNAAEIVDKAMPCPFCGERLVVKDDHHGEWVAHKDEPGPCECSASQLFNADDLRRWNRRAAPPQPDALPEDAYPKRSGVDVPRLKLLVEKMREDLKTFEFGINKAAALSISGIIEDAIGAPILTYTRTRAAEAADKMFPGSPSARHGFNTGVAWCMEAYPVAPSPQPDALKLAEDIISKIMKTFNDDLDPFHEGARCALEEALAAIRATREGTS